MPDHLVFLGVGLAILIIWVSMLRWPQAVQFFLFWILLEGAARKWLPGLGKPGFFIGHLILAGACLGYLDYILSQGGQLIPSAPFNAILFALFGWGMVQILNPSQLGILVWLLGMVTYFSFAPLAYLVPYAFPSKEKLLTFLKIITIMSLPLLIIGVIQYYSPAGNWINARPWGGLRHIAHAGGHVRVSSTFANGGAYAAFLPFLVLLALYLLSLKRLSQKMSFCLYVVLAGAFLNAFLTGSRHAVGYAVISSISYLFFSGLITPAPLKRLIPRLVAGGVAVLMLFALTSVGQDAIRSFQARGTEDLPKRLEQTTKFYRFGSLAGLIGIGIGSTYQGRQEITDVEVATGTHAEIERVFVELGPLGFALAYGLRVVVLWQLWLLSRRLYDRELRLLAVVGFLYLLQVLLGSLVYNYVVNKLFWFIAGFILLLPRLDQAQIKKKPCLFPR